ncbi:MAG: electron transfer flavoprotein subunit alpha/FixB family protein [Candidatus Neomarinimicrobiota bacterium]|nr:electron transfer flavoprotein subunit alpha/FixB family protein [Candidatus Neomarinimicrobiota bacterium]
MILVVLENQRGNIHAFSQEAVVAGQQLSEKLGLDLSILCLGENASSLRDQASDYKAKNLILAQHDIINTYSADGYSKALSQIVSELSPKYVLMGHSYMVRDFLPRVSAKLDIPFVSDIIAVEYDGDSPIFSRQVFNAKLATKVKTTSDTVLLSFQSAAFSSDDMQIGGSENQSDFSVNLEASDIKSDSEAEFQESASGVDLTTAELIVSVGRGIESQDNLPLVESLASAMGAEIASSRPVVDMGWLPPYRQIGSSGQAVSPKLYLSVGISGAIQHVVGMKGSKTIMAINKDEDAPIFEIADYAIIGDLMEIVPKLTEEIQK